MLILAILLNHISEIVVTLFFIFWLLQRKRQRLNLPPGPGGVPFLGYFPFVNSQTIHHDFIAMGKKYGSKIIHFKLGFDHVVVLSILPDFYRFFLPEILPNSLGNSFNFLIFSTNIFWFFQKIFSNFNEYLFNEYFPPLD